MNFWCNKLLNCGSMLQMVVFAVKTLQEIYLAHNSCSSYSLHSHQHLGCGVSGVLFNDRRVKWVGSMSLELFRKVGAYAHSLTAVYHSDHVMNVYRIG